MPGTLGSSWEKENLVPGNSPAWGSFLCSDVEGDGSLVNLTLDFMIVAEGLLAKNRNVERHVHVYNLIIHYLLLFIKYYLIM